jgi:hypothetical protein
MALSKILCVKSIQAKTFESKAILELSEKLKIQNSSVLKTALGMGFSGAKDRKFVKRMLTRDKGLTHDELKLWARVLNFPNIMDFRIYIWEKCSRQELEKLLLSLADSGNFQESFDLLEDVLIKKIHKQSECFDIRIKYFKAICKISENYGYMASEMLAALSKNQEHKAYFLYLHYASSLRNKHFNNLPEIRENNYIQASKEIQSITDNYMHLILYCKLTVTRANHLRILKKWNESYEMFQKVLKTSEEWQLIEEKNDSVKIEDFKRISVISLINLADIRLTTEYLCLTGVKEYIERAKDLLKTIDISKNKALKLDCSIVLARYYLRLEKWEKVLEIYMNELVLFKCEPGIISPFARARIIEGVTVLEKKITAKKNLVEKLEKIKDQIIQS